MWGPIIAAILGTLGPLLTQWLQAWLDDLLKTSAKGLGKPPKDKAAAHDALLGEAISRAPYFAFARKRLLKKLRAAGPSPTASDLTALRALAADAGAE